MNALKTKKELIQELEKALKRLSEVEQLKKALRGSEENFRRTLEGSPFGILIVNSDDEIIYANRALLEIFGYDSIEEFRSIPIQARYTPESYAEYLIRKKKRECGEEIACTCRDKYYT